MNGFFLKGYAVQILLEASTVEGDALDKGRYYRLEAGVGTGRACSYSASGKNWTPTLSVKSVDTHETITSEQGASIVMSGDSELAADLVKRIRPMDRLRVEMTNGNGWKLAFDGFVNGVSRQSTSSTDSYSSGLSINASGLWKFLAQSWFNWQGVVQPGYDTTLTKEGQSLVKWLASNKQAPGQKIIRAFIETALAMVDLKTSEGRIEPSSSGNPRFFQFGSGNEWKSAFTLEYPVPILTLQSWKGPLVGMIQMMAQPDIHECFCTYRNDGATERPTIIFRPRPFPGAEGDDEGWKALKVHNLQGEPAAKSVRSDKNDSRHPNAFHWAQGSGTDSGFTDFEQKVLRGYMVDMRSLKRYGFSARPVSSTLPPLGQIKKDDKGQFVDDVQAIMRRIAYQEACLPELWNRTIQLPLRPGIRAGDVVEDYSSGKVWTGYVASVAHRLSSDPWGGMTTLTLVRCLQCTAKDYPGRVRELVSIEFKPYVASLVSTTGGVKMALCHPQDPAVVAATRPVANIPFGSSVIGAANARGVPPWVLAHMLHIESSFGTKEGNGGGIMQFLPETANDLNNQGYDKPFSLAVAKKDPALSLDAAAWYVRKQKATVDTYCPSSLTEDERWSWAVYGYNQGLGSHASKPQATGWQFSAGDKALPEFGTYWGLGAIQQARSTYGGLR